MAYSTWTDDHNNKFSTPYIPDKIVGFHGIDPDLVDGGGSGAEALELMRGSKTTRNLITFLAETCTGIGTYQKTKLGSYTLLANWQIQDIFRHSKI